MKMADDNAPKCWKGRIAPSSRPKIDVRRSRGEKMPRWYCCLGLGVMGDVGRLRLEKRW